MHGGYLDAGIASETPGALRRHTRTGRPLGSAAFLETLEAALGRSLRPHKPGRKPKSEK